MTFSENFSPQKFSLNVIIFFEIFYYTNAIKHVRRKIIQEKNFL